MGGGGGSLVGDSERMSCRSRDDKDEIWIIELHAFDRTASKARLGRRLITPVGIGAHECREEGRNVDAGVVRQVLACLEDEHLDFGIFRQPICNHQTGCTAPNDDVIRRRHGVGMNQKSTGAGQR